LVPLVKKQVLQDDRSMIVDLPVIFYQWRTVIFLVENGDFMVIERNFMG
jgi:hypothetical protein